MLGRNLKRNWWKKNSHWKKTEMKIVSVGFFKISVYYFSVELFFSNILLFSGSSGLVSIPYLIFLVPECKISLFHGVKAWKLSFYCNLTPAGQWKVKISAPDISGTRADAESLLLISNIKWLKKPGPSAELPNTQLPGALCVYFVFLARTQQALLFTCHIIPQENKL